MRFHAGSLTVKGGVYLQSYKPGKGKVTGHFGDGSPAIIDNRFGKGRTRLIGTSPGYGNYGIEQHITCNDSRLVARIHCNGNRKVLWIVNSARERVRAVLTLSSKWGTFDKHTAVLKPGSISASGNRLEAVVPARDVAIIHFQNIHPCEA